MNFFTIQTYLQKIKFSQKFLERKKKNRSIWEKIYNCNIIVALAMICTFISYNCY